MTPDSSTSVEGHAFLCTVSCGRRHATVRWRGVWGLRIGRGRRLLLGSARLRYSAHEGAQLPVQSILARVSWRCRQEGRCPPFPHVLPVNPCTSHSPTHDAPSRCTSHSSFDPAHLTLPKIQASHAVEIPDYSPWSGHKLMKRPPGESPPLHGPLRSDDLVSPENYSVAHPNTSAVALSVRALNPVPHTRLSSTDSSSRSWAPVLPYWCHRPSHFHFWIGTTNVEVSSSEQ